MFKIFYPREYYDSTYSIDFKRYYDMGYRAVIFDVDNTLVEHDAPANERSTRLIKCLMDMGFQVCFLSNNDEQRVADFNKNLGAHYIYKAGKPLAKGYRAAMDRMGSDRENTMFVGDQIFTDIWGANNACIRSILVKPIAKREEIQIVLSLTAEKRNIKWQKQNFPMKLLRQ